MFDSSLLVGEDVIVQPSLYRKGVNHSLHSIFQYLAHGYSPKKIREMQCDLLPESIEKVRGILVDRNAQFFPCTKTDKGLQDFRVLVDENISPATTGYLRTHFKKVSHTHDAGLTGRKDDKVLLWAIENGYNIIFTKDAADRTERDLTFLATEDARNILRAMEKGSGNNLNLSDIPLIVHLSGGCDAETELKKLLRRNKKEFFDYLNNRATPYLDIRDGRIACGPTYFELRGGNYLEDNEVSESSLAHRIESREHFKALWLGKLTAHEIRNMNAERERKVDEQIDGYFARCAEREAQALRKTCLSRLPAQNLYH